MSITISRATPTDAKELLDYFKTIGDETDNLSFGSEGLPFSVEQEENYLKGLESSNRSVLFLAKDDGKIIGCSSLDCINSPRMAHRGSYAISVRKDYWGKGVGSLLTEKIINFAKNTAKINVISLEVRSDNQRAISLYQKFGFVKIGQFKDFFIVKEQKIDFDLMNLYLE